MKKLLISGALMTLIVISLARHWIKTQDQVNKISLAPQAQLVSTRATPLLVGVVAQQAPTSTVDVASNAAAVQALLALTNLSVSCEMDMAVNPYAGGLREPGKSKREWDPNFINQFQTVHSGDQVHFELTQGVMAEGTVKIVQEKNGQVKYVSGTLMVPDTGTFFFLTPPAGGKAGKAVGVIEFPASKTAYRIEPTGADGGPELWQRRLDEVICMGMPEADPALLQSAATTTNEMEEITPVRPDFSPDYAPSYNSNIVSLQSYPGSPAVLLLDFFGGSTAYWGGVTYGRPEVDNNIIKDIWKRVAEDYMPFNINVTTDMKVYRAAAEGSRMRVCFSPDAPTVAGVAYEGSWNWGGDVMCWSHYIAGKGAAEVAAHEPGHTLGLSHETQQIPTGDGTNTTFNGYFAGHGSGATGWAPIMGAGYYDNVTTWSHGEYQYAANFEDQLNIIVTANNNVTYRVDDTGDTLATSRYLEVYTNNTVSAEGVIEQTGDIDAFQFTTTGGAVSLTAQPVGDWADLALMATLADATDAVIASNNPQNVLSASITTNLPAGAYTFRVTGAGRNDPVTNGFSNYASLGYYSISGTVAGARQPTRLTVAEHAPVNTVVGSVMANNPNSSPLIYSIISGNTDGTFSVDNSGMVTVANNALLDYYKLQTNTTVYGVQFELLMNITNVNNPALTELNRRVVIAVQKLYPPVPVVTAAADSSLRIKLSWNSSREATGYNIKRSITSGGPYATIASQNYAGFTDVGQTNGATYYYVVSAFNANGESANSSEVSATALAVPNFGFELPNLSAGNYSYNPSGGSWAFNGAAGNGSGVLANGSAFGNPSAPEGTQAAFMQSYGSFSQTLSGFIPGKNYTITYYSAQRSGSNGGESWNVMIDGNVISSNSPGSTSYTNYTENFTATAPYHTLAFVGTDLAGGDRTVFIDDVTIQQTAPARGANFGFETPSIATYQYNPSGATWAFNGAAPSGSGIAHNGSAFGNPASLEGVQAAFIQEFGIVSQTLNDLTPGVTYTVSYLAAQRGGSKQHGGQTWNVLIDNTVIQSNNVPGSTSYTLYSATFTATASSQVLKFAGTDLIGGDNTVFIDNVAVGAGLQPLPPPTVALISPVNGSAYRALSSLNLAAVVVTNGNAISGVQFFADGNNLGQINDTPYTFAWGNPGMGQHTIFARVIFNNGSSADSAPVNLAAVASNFNLGFESPGVGSGSYAYYPTNASWNFSQNIDLYGSGILANGSAFGNPNAPEGSQAAFVQGYGNFSQALSGFEPGTNYTITYSAAQRSGASQHGGESWNVLIDGNIISSNSPGSTSYTTYTVSFTATASYHTLAFAGTDLNGGDNTVFIDNIYISPVLLSVTLTTSDASGKSSFNSAGNWSDALVPSSGKAYATSAFTLRSPTASGSYYMFGGDSLSIDSGGRLLAKFSGTGTLTITNLILNGGYLDEANGSDNGILILAGNLMINTSSGIGAANGTETLEIAATISGNGSLQQGGTNNGSLWPGLATETGLVKLDAANPYGGTYTIPNTGSGFNAPNAVSRMLQLNNLNALSNATLNLTIANVTNPVSFAAGVNTGAFNVGALSGSASEVLSDTAGNPVVLSVGGNNGSTTYSGALSGNGSLTKMGTGTFTLSGINTYTGNTIVSNGTLELVNAVLATNSTVRIANGATLQLDFATTNLVTGLVLNGVPQPIGVYNHASSPSYIAGSGSLQISPLVATNSANIVVIVSGGNLVLGWPADHTGWHLQAQTNSLGQGLGANWVDVAGTSTVNSFTNSINPTNGSVFYRLTYP